MADQKKSEKEDGTREQHGEALAASTVELSRSDQNENPESNQQQQQQQISDITTTTEQFGDEEEDVSSSNDDDDDDDELVECVCDEDGEAGEEEDDDDDDDSEEDEQKIAEKRKKLEEEHPYGCQHYRRRCKLEAVCCQKYFWCRHCHNEASAAANPRTPHELDRHKVERVECGICQTQQPVSNLCIKCGTKFGEYFCEICRFYDDDLSKDTFHCEQCGICRVGGRNNFFHCDTCGCCYALALRDNHRCIQGSMHQNCPVCQENLFHSTLASRVLRCGHMIHHACLKELMPVRYTCPLCNESVGDMTHYFRQLDNEVAAFEMPQEYRDMMVNILCNDCHETCQVNFHVIGLKCKACGSYNTRRV